MTDHSPAQAPARRSLSGRFAIFIVLIIAVYGLTNRRGGSHLPWLKDYDAAIAEARSRRVPILLDFWADWCGPCQSLDARVFSATSVEAAAKDFVLMRVDLSNQSPDTPAAGVARRYRVSALPTVLVVDAEHESLIAHAGAEDESSAKAFTAFLERHAGKE